MLGNSFFLGRHNYPVKEGELISFVLLAVVQIGVVAAVHLGDGAAGIDRFGSCGVVGYRHNYRIIGQILAVLGSCQIDQVVKRQP